MLIHFSVGYFISDLIITAYLGVINVGITFNHTACILVMIAILSTGIGSNYCTMAMFNLTFPKVMMKFRAILRHLGMR